MGPAGAREVVVPVVEDSLRIAGETSERSEPRGPHWVLIALVLLVGGVAGWNLRGSGNDSGVIVVGGDLTERQEEMLRVGDEFHRAFIEGDGDVVAALFVSAGVMVDPVNDRELRVDDGSLADQINRGPAPSYRVDQSVVVHGDIVVHTGSWGGDWVHVLVFTSSGDVRIVRDALVW